MTQVYDLQRLKSFLKKDSKSFRMIKSIDYHDYDESWDLAYRISARAIIPGPGNTFLLEYIARDGYYVFPGGGVEDGESLEDALIREVREESGFAVDASSIQRYGQIVLKKSNRDYAGFDQRYIGISVYFKVNSLGKQFHTDMTDNEKDWRMTPKYMKLEDAIVSNEAVYRKFVNSPDEKLRRSSEFIFRETAVMKDLLKNSHRNSFGILRKESVEMNEEAVGSTTQFTNKPYLDTPAKVISRMYDGLKANYTKQGAIQFYNYYSSLPLSDILDCNNAAKIISEPYKGHDFMFMLLSDTTYVPMYRMKSLLSIVSETFGKAITSKSVSDAQAKQLSNCILSLQVNLGGLKYGCIEDIVETMLADDKSINNYFDWADDMYQKFYKGELKTVTIPEGVPEVAYFPEVLRLSVGIKNVSAVYNLIFNTDLQNDPSPDDTCDEVYTRVIFARLLNAMTQCTAFIEAFSRLPDKLRLKIKEIANTDYEVLKDEHLTIHESADDAIFASPADFMESMVTNFECEEVLSEESRQTKIKNLLFEKTVLEATRDFESMEYMYSCEDAADDEDNAESVTSKLKLESVRSISERCNAIDEDLVLLEFKDNGDPSDVINKSMGVEPDKPDQGSLARRVQNKAIDTDIQAKKVAANAKKSAQQTRNTAKAITKIPREATDLVNKRIKEWDDLDDERRKEYMIKPGFRKKYWKALKIAIAHLLVFKISPIINIILAACHFVSAKKDKRIRNELIQELDTEIKVLNQKVEDAKGNGDRQASYKLMRMQDKLMNERNRVASNSTFL